MKTSSFSRCWYALLPALILWGGSVHAAPVELADEPVGLEPIVAAPAILVTADDSGSMWDNYIPDELGFAANVPNACWNNNGNAIHCGVYSERNNVVATAFCQGQRPPMLAAAYNGMAYNPLIDYHPPRLGQRAADGTPQSLPEMNTRERWAAVVWREPNGATPPQAPREVNLQTMRCTYSAGFLTTLQQFYLRGAPNNAATGQPIWTTSTNAGAVFDTNGQIRPHYYRTSVKWCNRLRGGAWPASPFVNTADPGTDLTNAAGVRFQNCRDERIDPQGVPANSPQRFIHPYYYSSLGDNPAAPASVRDNLQTTPFELVVLDAQSNPPRVFSSRTGNWTTGNVVHPYYDEEEGGMRNKTRTVAQEITNYANWRAYYSNRIAATNTAASIAFDEAIPYGRTLPPRMAINTINADRTFTIRPLTDGANRTGFMTAVRNVRANGGTPLVPTLIYNGEQFLRNQNQEIIHFCQRSYNILFTDGYWNAGRYAEYNRDGAATIGRLPAAPGFTTPLPATTGVFAIINNDHLNTLTTNTNSIPGCRETDAGFSQRDMGADGVTVYHPAGFLHANQPWPDPIRDRSTATGALAGPGGPGTPGNSHSWTGIGTLSDVALHYWSTALGGNVDSGLEDEYGNPILMCQTRYVLPTATDPATWLHLNFYGMGFGVQGTLPSKDQDATLQEIISGDRSWPTPARPVSGGGASSPETVDDLWHAAVNGFGRFVAAQTPVEFYEGLRDIIQEILEAEMTGGPGVAFSGLDMTLGVTQHTYTPFYFKGGGGDIIKKEINSAGVEIEPPLASAAEQLHLLLNPPAPNPAVVPWKDTRQVFTAVNNSGVRFSATEGTFSGTGMFNTLGANATERANVLAYLRGDRSREGDVPGSFRTRGPGPLGAFYDAKPVVLTAPEANEIYKLYKEDRNPGYAAFANAHSGRATMVYAAANDGMLHAFDEDLEEQWAFIPSDLFRSRAQGGIVNLRYRSADSPPYQPFYYVNATPRVSEVYMDSAPRGRVGWHTVLVGGLGKGGTSYYALNVTEAGRAGAGNDEAATAQRKVLWEYTHPNMGYTFGLPYLAKTKAGDWGYDHGAKRGSRWMAVFPSGHNNGSGFGQPKNGSGRACLFFVDVETGGALAREEELCTGEGSPGTPLGMAQIGGYVHHYSNQLATAFYGGDQRGNLWRFNLENEGRNLWREIIDNAADALQDAADGVGITKMALLKDSGGKDQWVTTIPWPQRDAEGDRWVLVGTGGFRSDDDLTAGTGHTFYAIRDGGVYKGGRSAGSKSIHGLLRECHPSGVPDFEYEDCDWADTFIDKDPRSTSANCGRSGNDDCGLERLTEQTRLEEGDDGEWKELPPTDKMLKNGWYEDAPELFHFDIDPTAAYGKVAYAANKYIVDMDAQKNNPCAFKGGEGWIGRIYARDIRTGVTVILEGGLPYTEVEGGVADIELIKVERGGEQFIELVYTTKSGGLGIRRIRFQDPPELVPGATGVPTRHNMRYIQNQ